MSRVQTSYDRISAWEKTKLITVLMVIFLSYFGLKIFASDLYYRFFLPHSVKIKNILSPDLSLKTLPVDEAYRTLEKTELNLSKNVYGLSPKDRAKLLEVVNREREFIETEYPFPNLFALLNPHKYAGNRGVSWAFYLVLLVLTTGGIMALLLYDSRKLRPFFYQVGRKEPALAIGKPFTLIDWEFFGLKPEFVFGEVFKGRENWELLTAIYDRALKYDVLILTKKESERDRDYRDKAKVVLNLYRIHYDVWQAVRDLEEYALRVGLIKEEEIPLFRASVVMALFHYVLSFFGNVPTESFAINLKNYTAKRFFTSYYYLGKTINTLFKGVVKEKDKQASFFMKAFHGFRKEKKDFLKELKEKHCQVPDIM